MKTQKIRSKERGTAFTEYLVAVTALLGVLILGANALTTASHERARLSSTSVKAMVPCTGNAGQVLGSSPNECY